jgi:hypothetical protein
MAKQRDPRDHFERIAPDLITEPGASFKTRVLALLLERRAGAEYLVKHPSGDHGSGYVQRHATLDQKFYDQAKLHGFSRKQVDAGVAKLQAWPKNNPLIRRRTYREELILRDPPYPGAPHAKLYHVLLDSLQEHWVLRSILLTRLNFAYQRDGESRFYIPRRHKRDKGFRARRKRTELDLTRLAPEAYGQHDSRTRSMHYFTNAMQTSGVWVEYPDPQRRLNYQSTCALHDNDPDKLARLKRLIDRMPRPAAKPRPAATRKTAQVGTPNREGYPTSDAEEMRRSGHRDAQVGTPGRAGRDTKPQRSGHIQEDTRHRSYTFPTPTCAGFPSEKSFAAVEDPPGPADLASAKTPTRGLLSGCAADSAIGGLRPPGVEGGTLAAGEARAGQANLASDGRDRPTVTSEDQNPIQAVPAAQVGPVQQERPGRASERSAPPDRVGEVFGQPADPAAPEPDHSDLHPDWDRLTRQQQDELLIYGELLDE